MRRASRHTPLSLARELSSPADLSRMLAAAQSQLRGLPPEDLRGISPSSAILKTITDYSFSAAPMTDLRSQAELAAAAALEQEKAPMQARRLAARMVRIAMERANVPVARGTTSLVAASDFHKPTRDNAAAMTVAP